MSSLKGKKIVIFVEEQFNEHEFFYPKYRSLEAEATIVVAGTKAKTTYRSKTGMTATSDVDFDSLDANAFDGVIIPGGYAPDYMRRSKACCKFVHTMDEQGKLVAFICHAGWVCISAGILRGRKATSVAAIKDDMLNAGAIWEDAAVVRDKNMISSRTPDDLPAFMKAVTSFWT